MTSSKSSFFGDLSPTFKTSAISVLVILLVSLLFPQKMAQSTGVLFSYIIHSFGWFFVLSMSFFLFSAFFLCFSRLGNIRLGPDDSRPEFSYLSWLAMLFSAGMGIGMLFYGVAEPILHFARPAPPVAVPGVDIASQAKNAMGLTFFHWGLHPWACYSMVALIMAYFSFRKKLPLSIHSALSPVVPESFLRRWGFVIDSVAVVATLFGVATSLGLGASQINAGFSFVFGFEDSITFKVIAICLITFAATVSVVSGVEKGIRWLSEINMCIAAFLLLAIFILGPTAFLLDFFVENIGNYLGTLINTSFWTAALHEKRQEWLGSWTIFYWAWWISWSPFVGTFLARISRGRTIREFTVGVLIVPTVLSLVWFTVFGGSAIYGEITNTYSITEAVKENAATALFVFLEHFPFAMLFKVLAIVSVILFFITSSDSASFVVDILTSRGKLNPSVKTKVFWAVSEGALAAILLTVGGLKALQTAAVCIGLPFCVILVTATYGFFRELRKEVSPD